ncbi:MAG: hypothetical protein ISF22_07980 [Methanomassiliicoccus sp.]|nr:hypothetical protein [Methanomassiliicoccus sp.]
MDRNQAFAVLLFGVFIDLDHAFGLVEFVSQEGLRNSFSIDAALASNIQWKSLFHSPEAALLVAPVAVSYRLAAPLIAWAAHLAMDYVQQNMLGIMSGPEFLFLGLLLAVLFYSELRLRRHDVPDTKVRGFLIWERDRIALWAGDLPGIRSIRRRIIARGTSS